MNNGCLNLLIVEDEPLIAMMLADMVEVLGHRLVGTAETIDAAGELIEAGGFNVAILDVHLSGLPIWPVADRLAEAGVPFVLATGAQPDELPERHRNAPVLMKPYALNSVEQALERFKAAA
jgi:response regulator of citrate/malate metabolism